MGNPHPNLRPYKPGQSGNPSGKPKYAYSADQVRARIQNLMAQPLSALKEQRKSESISGMDAMIISCILEGYKTGDFGRLNGLLDRIVGKVTDKSEVKVETAAPDELLDSIPKEALLKLAQGE